MAATLHELKKQLLQGEAISGKNVLARRKYNRLAAKVQLMGGDKHTDLFVMQLAYPPKSFPMTVYVDGKKVRVKSHWTARAIAESAGSLLYRKEPVDLDTKMRSFGDGARFVTVKSPTPSKKVNAAATSSAAASVSPTPSKKVNAAATSSAAASVSPPPGMVTISPDEPFNEYTKKEMKVDKELLSDPSDAMEVKRHHNFMRNKTEEERKEIRKIMLEFKNKKEQEENVGLFRKIWGMATKAATAAVGLGGGGGNRPTAESILAEYKRLTEGKSLEEAYAENVDIDAEVESILNPANAWRWSATDLNLLVKTMLKRNHPYYAQIGAIQKISATKAESCEDIKWNESDEDWKKAAKAIRCESGVSNGDCTWDNEKKTCEEETFEDATDKEDEKDEDDQEQRG